MLNTVIFGPPGAGKGTQAKMAIDKFNLIHFSTGDMLRAERAAGTELGKKVAAIMDSGKLVSDEIVIAIIESKLDQNVKGGGFIFDGFPRTVAQAEALDNLLRSRNLKINCTVSLEVPEKELVIRLLNRAKQEGRADDTEAVIQERIREYHAKTKPVANHYSQQGKLKAIDGTGSVADIFGRISSILDASGNEA